MSTENRYKVLAPQTALDWEPGVDYKAHQKGGMTVVVHDQLAYVCMQTHLSTEDNKPGTGWPWNLLATPIGPADPLPEDDDYDGGITEGPVDRRDCFTFAEFAETTFWETKKSRDRELKRYPANTIDSDNEMVLAMARRCAVLVLGAEAADLEWKVSPLSFPRQAQHKLEKTDHLLHYRPNDMTGEFGLWLERYCRLCVKTEYFEVTSLSQLGALLNGQDAKR